MNRKIVICYIVFFIVAIVCGWFIFMSKYESPLEKLLLTEKNRVEHLQDKKGIGIITEIEVYDENDILIEKRKMQLLLGTSQYRIDVKDYQSNKQYIMIRNNDEFWFNESFSPLDVRILALTLGAIGWLPQRHATLIRSECGKSKVHNEKCFVLTVVYFTPGLPDMKIKGYLNTIQTEWLKLEIFLKTEKEEWIKERDIYPEETKIVGGLRLPTRSTGVMYLSQGKQIKIKEIASLVKQNVNIDKSIFQIPKKK